MKESVVETIGSPLVKLDLPDNATVAAKLEYFNPGGSAKDRPALEMVEEAERNGTYSPGDTLVEVTSGNTGVGLALVAAARGYDLKILMPREGTQEETRRLMEAYGANVQLVDGDFTDAKDIAYELDERDDHIFLSQGENEANPDAHYRTTAEEIIDSVGDREVDAFVSPVATGGTITGNARRLLEEFPEMEVVAVEPARNPIFSKGEPGDTEFTGISSNFISDVTDTSLFDSIESVSYEAAVDEAHRLAQGEGILVGETSAGASVAAQRVAKKLTAERDDPLVVTLFWDSGERYFSSGLFE